MLALTSLSLGLPTAPTPPTFALDYYVGRQDALAINQGGYKIENGVCCSMKNSASCKIQGINLGGDTYEQGSKSRTRLDSAQGAVVTWFGDVMKQMVIEPSNGTAHQYDCVAFCPAMMLDRIGIMGNTRGVSDRPIPSPRKLRITHHRLLSARLLSSVLLL